MMLWTASAYLLRHNKLHWVTTVPAFFMTSVCVTFILNSETLGFGMPMSISTTLGVVFSILVTSYVIKSSKGKGESFIDSEANKNTDSITENA